MSGLYALMVLWNLEQSEATFEDLRHYIEGEAVAAYSALDGLVLKTWVADEPRNVWGAIYLWESKEAAWSQPLPSRAIEIIGYPPNTAAEFAVEGLCTGMTGVALDDIVSKWPQAENRKEGGVG